MSMDRRQFLKYSGIASILGFGASAASATNLITGKQLLPPQVDMNKEALRAKRWAMVVDMSKFRTDEDFQRTISACHTIHNVPDFRKPDGTVDRKFEIKWIWKAPYERSFPGQENPYMSEHVKDMPFMVLCNHCTNPPCVRVCPTKATYKLADGITMQDMHRCIGCRFCMAACPYGSRSFNWVDPRRAANLDPAKGGKVNSEYPTRTKGVVEKCTFCTERLAVGKMPACVEAAPKGALLFGDLEDPNSEVRKIVANRLTIRRKPDLGTGPAVYYLIGGEEHA
jgi:Fe-S-cluster-containing dehydrogenase component